MLDVFFTSQGVVAQYILNAVATFYNSSESDTLFWMMGCIGLFAVLCRLLMKHDLKEVLFWVLSYVFITAIAFNLRTSVSVHDTTRPLAQYKVDNVPLGLAYPLFFATGISNYVTDTLEGIMHVPNDLSYEKYGMVWGSTIFSQMNQSRVNPELLGYFARYLRQCVYPEIKLRKNFTYKQLTDAPDIFDFLQQRIRNGVSRVHIPNANPNEPNATDFPFCGTATTWIIDEFKKDATINIGDLYKYNANNQALTLAQMQASVQNVYQHFFNMSGTAQNTMMQNLAINAVNDGFRVLTGASGNAAAALNYSKVQGEMSRKATWVSAGMFAQEFIPMLHTILMLLMVCAFIPVGYMLLFPGYLLHIVKKYVGGLIWLATWSIFYVFVNFIMTSILSLHLQEYSGGYSGLTMSNLNGLESLTWKYAAATGWILAFIPYLSRMLTVGAGHAMMGIATSMTSSLMSDAEKGSRAMSEGNISAFNTSIGTHNGNNMHFEQHSLRPTETMGGGVRSSLAGGMQYQTPQGDTVYDNSGVIDRQPFDMMQRESVSTGLSKTQAQYEKNAFAQAKMMNESVSSGANFLNQTGKTQALKDYAASSESTNETAQVARAASKLADFHSRFSQDQINASMNGLNAEAGFEFKAGTGNAFKFFSANGYLKAGGSYGKSNTTNDSVGMSASEAKAYRESFDTLLNANKSDLATLDKAIGVDKGQSMQSTFGEAKAYSESAQRNYDLSVQAGEAANYAKNHDFTLGENLMPKFKDYLDDHYGEQSRNQWLGNIDQQNDPMFKKAQENFVVANSDVYMDWYKENSSSIDSRQQTAIDGLSHDVTQGQAAVHQARAENDQAVNKENIIMQAEVEQGIYDRKGESMQSTVPMIEQVHRDNFALMKELGMMPKDHEFKGKFAEYNNTQTPFDLERPDMSRLDQTNQSVNDQAQNIIGDKDKMATDVKHNIDRGLVSITKEYRDLHNPERTEEKDKMLKNPMLPPSLQ
ncbi:conjugal transfer protein TraG N-terminal domain-containing protein [Cysteiniphilum marinum]|uniref:conjugal transfer protein TraG N-terminal domain-containing protein n=1 Tax=Cysteiniphilum marinum TaxID=2774191 RepID=UPI00193AF3A9|nr:conjugal transfer protein TraG N-terminal domain-containing protein [Cysteiniphilum marinum]